MGARLWVLDPTDAESSMPQVVIGELLINGPIVANGHLHDDAKTKDGFIVNPQWHPIMRQGGTVRLHETGDLVNLGSACSYTHTCRKNTQIKVNG